MFIKYSLMSSCNRSCDIFSFLCIKVELLTRKNVGRDLILSIRNWLDHCCLLLLWSHVSDRLSCPLTSKRHKRRDLVARDPFTMIVLWDNVEGLQFHTVYLRKDMCHNGLALDSLEGVAEKMMKLNITNTALLYNDLYL